MALTDEIVSCADCDWWADVRDDRGHVQEFYEHRRLHDPPCKHEWRQYMAVSYGQEIVLNGIPYVGDAPPVLQPDGFFCIHCTERKDE